MNKKKKFLRTTKSIAITAFIAFCGLFLMTSCDDDVTHWHDWKWDEYVSGSGLRRCQVPGCIDGPPLVAGTLDPGPAQAGVGDIGPAGGIIFNASAGIFNLYLNEFDNTIRRCNYLEAAPMFNASSSYNWPSEDIRLPMMEIINGRGTGLRNTLLILEANPAAKIALDCKNFRYGGKDDWYLPSSDELTALYDQRSRFTMYQGWYWSSTPSTTSPVNAWGRDFEFSQRGDTNRGKTGYIYAVRAF